ncbi:MAG: hypothetical protein Q7R41_13660, partial [Phycisphaerales bacterium]|nr:hypothetical protein [Phycisphaerales bacterium]
YVSTDGRSWRTDPISAQAELRALAFGGGRFVALALGKVVFSEGTGFNLVSSPTAQLLSITYGNGRFVAAAARSAFVSADAVTWIESYRSTFTIKSITYANDRFLALSGQGFIAISQDGKSWTERYLAKGGDMRGVAYGNGRYLIVAFYGDVLTSPDAVTWTLERSAIQRIRFTGVAFGKGMFVATSEDGAIHASEDGAQWTRVASEPGVALRSITFALDRFVAVGSQGVVLSSGDGKSWTSLSVGEPVQLTSVSYGEGVFMAVGESLTGWSSTDGRIWRPHLTRAPAASISYGEGAFVVASGSSVYSASPQPLQIQPLLAIVTPPADQEIDFGSTATLRVEATSPGTLRYQWRFNGLPLPGQTNAELILRNVSTEHLGSYGVEVSDENGTDTTPPAFLAVKRPAPDGLDDWAPRLPWPTSAHLEGVASGKGLLVAVGSNGAILVSSDGGAFWNSRPSAHAGSLNSVAFGNGRFVAVGANGS